MSVKLQQLSLDDDIDVYEMLTSIPKDENGFINGFFGRPFEDFKEWLTIQINMSKNIGLEDWMVPQNTYWLYADGIPVGMGKLRHYLTDKLRQEGGHCGYAIRASHRNKGYGTRLLGLLSEQARIIGIDRMLVTIDNGNTASIKVALANNGKIEKINENRHYIWIDCSE